MHENFDRALGYVLAHEGGYTNHPSDPGGPTNWGITLADARRYWKSDASAADVRAMPLPVAQVIYRARYWDALRCDELPSGVDYALFDYGVNSGVGRAIRVLRQLVRSERSGTKLSDVEIADIARANPRALVVAMCAERRAFLRRLKTWPVFGRGWARRVNDVEKNAIAMIDGGGRKSRPHRSAETVSKRLPPTPSPSEKAGAVVAAGAGIGTTAWGLNSSGWFVGIGIVLIAAAIGVTIWRWRLVRSLNVSDRGEVD